MLGRSLAATGLLVLLFVGYQLWGTGLRTAQAQSQLDQEFTEQLERQERRRDATPSTTAPGPDPTDPRPVPPTTTAPVPALPPPPVEGDAAGFIDIPALGIDDLNVVEGVTVEQLTRGPGHFPTTPLPGQAGNAAIAGHRTTYGAPFSDLDQLETGDEITVTTLQGESRYEVTEQKVVAPTDVAVVADQGDDRLTLTTCEPKYSAAQRLVIVARLVTEPVSPWPAEPDPAAAGGAETEADPDGGQTLPGEEVQPLPGEAPEDDRGAADTGRDGDVAPAGPDQLGDDGGDAVPAVAWGLTSAAVAVAGWAATRLVRRRGPRPRAVRALPYVLVPPAFLVALFFFFESVSLLLPASY